MKSGRPHTLAIAAVCPGPCSTSKTLGSWQEGTGLQKEGYWVLAEINANPCRDWSASGLGQPSARSQLWRLLFPAGGPPWPQP